ISAFMRSRLDIHIAAWRRVPDLDVSQLLGATSIARSNNSQIYFLRHIEFCAFFCQLLLEHPADMRVPVTVLDGVAALFHVETQTPPIDTRYTLDSPRIAAQEGQHTQRFLGCAEVTVKPAGIARRRAHDAARLVVLSLDQFALAVRPRRRPRLARPRDGVALAA